MRNISPSFWRAADVRERPHHNMINWFVCTQELLAVWLCCRITHGNKVKNVYNISKAAFIGGMRRPTPRFRSFGWN